MKKLTIIIAFLIGLSGVLVASNSAFNFSSSKLKIPSKYKTEIKVLKWNIRHDNSSGKVKWSAVLNLKGYIKKSIHLKVTIGQENSAKKIICSKENKISIQPTSNNSTTTISGEMDRCCEGKYGILTISTVNPSKKIFRHSKKLSPPAIELRKIVINKQTLTWKTDIRNNTSQDIGITIQGYQYVGNRWIPAGGQFTTLKPLSLNGYQPFWVTMYFKPNATKIKVEIKCEKTHNLLYSKTKNIP